MSKTEISETISYCATSSIVASDEAIKRNASTEQAKEDGVDIQRYSLAKNPQWFLDSPVVKKFLNTSGMDSLPAILLDGKFIIADKLPTREGIARWAGIPLSQNQSEDSAQPRCYSIPCMPQFQKSYHW